jgi:molecular chaperone DnaK
MPFLRDRLADRRRGLGIPLDFSVNPLTVVARGAAIFAGTQRLDLPAGDRTAGEYSIRLEHKPVGAETEPLVGGKVTGSGGEDLTGFTIEFTNLESRPPWRSGRIAIDADGTFVTTLLAERGRLNAFAIVLRTHSGDARKANPDRLNYTIGLAITDQPLIHSISVAKANNQVQLCLGKGTPLPARKRVVLRQAHEVRRGQQGAVIRVPIVEGENARADRNTKIGDLEIAAATIARDVPAGSEIEVTLSMDQSRTLTAVAFIPILDAEFEAAFDYSSYRREATDPNRLRKSVEQEIASVLKIRQQAGEKGDRKTLGILQRLDEEGLVEEIETSLAAASVDPDAADKCQKRMLELRLAHDEMEANLEWPMLVREAEEQIVATGELLEQYGDAAERALAESLERDVRKAVDGGDAGHLRGKLEELRGVHFRVLQERPDFWIGFLGYLQERREVMEASSQRDQLFARAAKAIDENDLPILQATVRQLQSLLPNDEQAEATKAFGSTVL